MKVRDLMTKGAYCIGADDTLGEASRRMKAADIGLLAVCEGGRLLGVITDRDIVVRALADGLDPGSTPVRGVMTLNPVSCDEDEELDGAIKTMEAWRVRRLPVLNAACRLVGVLSIDDIARPQDRRGLAGELLERTAGRRPPGK